ncbi:MAG: putative tellurium resistance membrane protein TerC [Arenicella sp.]|jgi:predicted tellurium resistance membrane protein TerC
MAELLTLTILVDILLLVMLQAVPGFDNLWYISFESSRAPLHQQKAIRFWGIAIAVASRII